MFFSVIFFIYILLNFYVYVRIRSLFRRKSHRLVLTILFAAFTVLFPVSEMVSHAGGASSGAIVLLLGYLSLPFLLYLFLLVLLSDILRGINRILKIVAVEKLQSRIARIVTLCMLLIVPTVIVIAGMAWFSDIRINRYSVQVPRRASPLKHLTVALASDFHLNRMTDETFLTRFSARVNRLQPDLLLIPGDVLEGDRQDGQLSRFQEAFRQIRTTYGVFGSLGNHESFGRRGNLGFFSRSNIVLLQDSTPVVGSAFTLVGRRDTRDPQRKPIEQLMRSVADSLPVIVLDHRPVDLEAISETHSDIVVSGHTHHGQLFPLNLITTRIYEVSWGYEKKGNTHVFVTSGIQVWGPPVRTAGDSEIMLIDVDFVDR